MAEVQLEIPVQVTPPPTFGDLEAKATPPKAQEPITPAPKAEPPPKADPPPATADKVDPAKPTDPPAKPDDKKPDDATKTDGDKKPDDPEKTEDKEKPVVPEKYDLKLSDNSLLNEAALEKIAAYAKVQGLSQEDAQALVKSQEGEVASAMAVAVEKRKSQWLEQCKSDKDIGGEKLNENVTLAKDMLDKYGDENFRKELTDGGFGNHPGLVRMLVKIGRASANDKAIIPKTTPTAVRSAAEIMYDKTPNN